MVAGGRSKEEQLAIARATAVAADQILGQIYQSIHHTEDMPGGMAHAQFQFFKWTGLNWWVSKVRRATATTYASVIGYNAEINFNSLPQQMKNTLLEYDIGEKDWELARSTVWETPDKTKFITPDRFDSITDDQIREVLEDSEMSDSAVKAFRDDLATRFQMFFVDQAEFGSPSPGGREKLFLLGGTRPGTLPGELLRFLTQFKSFPVLALTKNLGREMGDPMGKGAAMRSIAHLVVSTTILGYVSMTAKGILRNEEPRDPRDPKTLLAALAQGGGIGILSDFLFSEYSRFGKSPMVTVAGPAVGVADDVLKIWNGLRAGDDQSAEAAQLLINNTPYLNHFLLRPVLNYYVLNHFQEWLSPGYTARRRKQLQEKGTDFLFPPE